VSSSTDSRADAPLSSEDASEAALLEVYNTLREEILRKADNDGKRNIRGVAAMIVLIGYAVNFNKPGVITAIPVLFLYIIIRKLESQVWIYNAAYHLTQIEKELCSSDSAVQYEIKRGGLVGKDLDKNMETLRSLPGGISVFISLGSYLASIFILLIILSKIERVSIIAISISDNIFIAIYSILIVLCTVSGSCVYFYSVGLESKVTKNNAANRELAKQSDADEQNNKS
jgi:hypothetical protein